MYFFKIINLILLSHLTSCSSFNSIHRQPQNNANKEINLQLSNVKASAVPSCKNGNSLFIHLHGAIGSQSKKSWKYLFSGNRFSEINILVDSVGGQMRSFSEEIDNLALEDILASFKKFKNRGGTVKIFVPAGAKCKSACTAILAAGDEVISSNNATISFHGAWKSVEVSIEKHGPTQLEVNVDEDLTNWYLLKLLDNGISPDWIIAKQKAGVFSSTAFHDFLPKDLINTGFVSGIESITIDEFTCDKGKH